MNNSKAPWAQDSSEVLGQLSTDEELGLTQAEAAARLAKYGPNALPENSEETTLWGTIVNTFKEQLPMMLLISAAISAVLGFLMSNPDRFKDAASLAIILLFMAIANYAMDKNKDKGLAALKKMLTKSVRVKRDGQILDLDVSMLVVGDIVVLKEGDLIPADGRIVESVNGAANEASLTGESESVEKSTSLVDEGVELARRTNMLFMGTFVASGNLVMVVTATALETELGKIATEIQQAEQTETPLQKQLDQLGDWLLKGTLIVCGLVGLLYLVRAWPEFAKLLGEPSLANLMTSASTVADIFTVAVSLAIAFIPEALAAVIVLALAIGVSEMTKAGAIVKNPKAAEALGSVRIFNSDKTGTLTTGDMSVKKFWTLSHEEVDADLVLTGNGTFEAIRRLMAYCNDKADQTERAMAAFVEKAGYAIGVQTLAERVGMVPFTSARKRMSVLVMNGGLTLLTKGAPSHVLPLCQLSTTELTMIEAAVDRYANQGYRVLALASKPAQSEIDLSEDGLTFLALVALMDPPRPEVVETIKTIKAAGVTPVMITGDDGRTAQTIAREIGILTWESTPDQIMSGQELETLTAVGVDELEEEVLGRICAVRVFYRVSPIHKKSIVTAQQRKGLIVAMTGDGVNDAPALKQADIGVAMGDRATEVTKDVADMILTAGYHAVADAIRVGRTILMRTRLYTHALLSTNMAEVGLFIVAAVVGWATPLTSVMLLVINFLGDGWLSIALATEKAEKDVMVQKPRPSKEAVITPYMWMSIALQGVLVTGLLSYLFYMVGEYAVSVGLVGKEATKLQQSMVFAAFLVQKVLRSSFTARSLKFNLWQIGAFTNKWTLLAGCTTALMGLAFLEVPFLADFLGMTHVPAEIAPWLLVGLVPPVVEEVIKYVRRLGR